MLEKLQSGAVAATEKLQVVSNIKASGSVLLNIKQRKLAIEDLEMIKDDIDITFKE